jgi:hypothetical protein
LSNSTFTTLLKTMNQKKQRITPIAEPIQISQEAFTSSSLPNPETVNQAVAQVTGKPVPPPQTVYVQQAPPPQYFAPPQPPKQIGRPKKAIADGRIKYNTMLKPEHIKRLRIRAAENEMTPADLLELILQEAPRMA